MLRKTTIQKELTADGAWRITFNPKESDEGTVFDSVEGRITEDVANKVVAALAKARFTAEERKDGEDFKVYAYSLDDSGQPYAEITEGHVNLGRFLKQVNTGWSDTAWEPENTRYEYAVRTTSKDAPFRMHASPDEMGAVPVTVSYFEEDIPPPVRGINEYERAD